MNTRQGAVRLFRFAGIDVYLHFLWFLIAIYEIQDRKGAYSSPIFNILEYLGLFLIVLMHEFGHALACKQVGGRANQIMLWPLGGIAYVDPPPRPGATLWSIAAGPLVNVALVFVLKAMGMIWRSSGMPLNTDTFALLRTLATINFWLLAFNLLPIYPLDGGQILRSLLWYIFGRARSLTIAAVMGLFGVAALVYLAIQAADPWLGVVSFFILINCWNGLKHAWALNKIASLPRRQEFACPSCKASPPIGAVWRCSACTNAFDTFATGAQCPVCGMKFDRTACMDCGTLSPMSDWKQGVYVVGGTPMPTPTGPPGY